jgi:DNA-binding GntR family transcriptional regulator
MTRSAAEILDRESSTPLHSQLKAAIDARIESGEWPPEGQLPPERELCERFQVSRITVRQALHQLVTEGRLLRIHGRGTYVASSPLKKQLLPLVGFSEDMQSRGQKPGARVLRFEAAPASSPSPAVCGSLPAEVFVLKRLRLAGANRRHQTIRCRKLARDHRRSLQDRSLWLLRRSTPSTPRAAAL